MKKVILFAMLAVAVLVSVFTIRFFVQESTKMTGEEWMQRQAEYVEELQDYAKEMDDVFSLYIVGSMDVNDFYSHLSVLDQELTLLEANRSQYLSNHPIKTGSHTADTKGAVDAVDALYQNMRNIIDMGSQYAENTEELSYRYLAAQQEVSETLSKYIVNVYFQETQIYQEGEG